MAKRVRGKSPIFGRAKSAAGPADGAAEERRPESTANLVAVGGDKPVVPARSEAPADRKELFIGRDISLQGEISACDRLVVEGFVSVNMSQCQSILVARTGTFEGSADIGSAEIEGVFDGDLTAHECLTVRRTGRVSGRVRYARIEVEPGGEICGDVKALADGTNTNLT